MNKKEILIQLNKYFDFCCVTDVFAKVDRNLPTSMITALLAAVSQLGPFSWVLRDPPFAPIDGEIAIVKLPYEDERATLYIPGGRGNSLKNYWQRGSTHIDVNRILVKRHIYFQDPPPKKGTKRTKSDPPLILDFIVTISNLSVESQMIPGEEMYFLYYFKDKGLQPFYKSRRCHANTKVKKGAGFHFGTKSSYRRKVAERAKHSKTNRARAESLESKMNKTFEEEAPVVMPTNYFTSINSHHYERKKALRLNIPTDNVLVTTPQLDADTVAQID